MKFSQLKQDENFMLSGGKQGMACMFTSSEEMDAFEEAIRLILKRRQTELKMSDDTVGKIAFGFMGGPRTKVQALLVGQGAGKYRKPQRMRIPDMINLGEALGLKLNELIKEAYDIIKK